MSACPSSVRYIVFVLLFGSKYFLNSTMDFFFFLVEQCSVWSDALKLPNIWPSIRAHYMTVLLRSVFSLTSVCLIYWYLQEICLNLLVHFCICPFLLVIPSIFCFKYFVIILLLIHIQGQLSSSFLVSDFLLLGLDESE